jgi:hypothetical protein
MTTTLNAFAAIQGPLHPAQYQIAGQNITFTTGKAEYFPVPQGQIDAENSGGTINLKQIPGY